MNYSRPWMFCGLTLMAAGVGMLWWQSGFSAGQPSAEHVADRPSTPKTNERQKESPATSKKTTPLPPVKSLPPLTWTNLFDGKTLKGWKAPQFGGEGKVYIRDGAIVMEMGSMMTGVTWTGKPPRNNYELKLEGIRLDGSDFF